jgi:hypothetical protein
VPGHGAQLPGPFGATSWQLATPDSPGRHLFGVVALSLVPERQHGPRSVGGIGISAQVEPSGIVPSFTKVVCSALRRWTVPFGKTIACWSLTNSSGLKSLSLRSENFAGNGAILY